MNRSSLLRVYGLAIALSAALLVLVAVKGGAADLVKVLILAGLEITFSFDNAVVNARVLQRLSPLWQRLFMTVGIIIAVFGVRIVFPLVMVALTAKESMGRVVDLALHHPGEYADKLTTAYPLIAAFGGIFLLMVFLDFMLTERPVRWFERLEKNLARAGHIDSLSLLICSVVLVAVTFGLVPHYQQTSVLGAGIIGLVVYLFINSLDAVFSPDLLNTSVAKSALRVGLTGFLYLELIDASFSLDGVIGAFAITSKVLLIAAGLGIGALFVRSMTVHMLHHGTLAKYRYLEHGAHYAIGMLAAMMLLSLRWDIPQAVTGLSGLAVIVAAIVHSRFDNQHERTKAVS